MPDLLKKSESSAITEGVAGTLSSLHSMSKEEMKRVADFIGSQVGIQLPMRKQTLVEGRLRKRIDRLGFDSFTSYLDFVLNQEEGTKERMELIDVITTNKTNFFREPAHFEYLTDMAIPVRIKDKAAQAEKIAIWSAGCSTGEEAYTLSMVLSEAQEKRQDFKFEILATDISHSCLRTAGQGVYAQKNIDPVALDLRRKYLLKSRNPADTRIQMGPEIRNHIRFDICNLMDKNFSVTQKMDIIFCRNVMIYFNNEIKHALVNKFERQLQPGGYLFVGHSESLSGMKTQMIQVAPMVYRKKEN